jgi:hypothetical protein
MAADVLLARALLVVLQERRAVPLPDDVGREVQRVAFMQAVAVNKCVPGSPCRGCPAVACPALQKISARLVLVVV